MKALLSVPSPISLVSMSNCSGSKDAKKFSCKCYRTAVLVNISFNNWNCKSILDILPTGVKKLSHHHIAQFTVVTFIHDLGVLSCVLSFFSKSSKVNLLTNTKQETQNYNWWHKTQPRVQIMHYIHFLTFSLILNI